MLEKLQSQPAPDQLPDLNEESDTDNEFVKQYLEQRQKVFAAQMEARRRLEGKWAVIDIIIHIYLYIWWSLPYSVCSSLIAFIY